MLALHRINARDRRRAAAHEAGHIVVAQHFGIAVLGAAIWPVNREDPLLEATWSGQISVFRGSDNRPDVWRAIGIAGTVAEAIWFDRDGQADLELFWDFAFDEVAAMSPSDWRLCCAEPEIDSEELETAAADVAGLLLGELRETLIKTARRLIIEARTSTPINS